MGAQAAQRVCLEPFRPIGPLQQLTQR